MFQKRHIRCGIIEKCCNEINRFSSKRDINSLLRFRAYLLLPTIIMLRDDHDSASTLGVPARGVPCMHSSCQIQLSVMTINSLQPDHGRYLSRSFLSWNDPFRDHLTPGTSAYNQIVAVSVVVSCRSPGSSHIVMREEPAHETTLSFFFCKKIDI